MVDVNKGVHCVLRKEHLPAKSSMATRGAAVRS
jgi:hypothetical protein